MPRFSRGESLPPERSCSTNMTHRPWVVGLTGGIGSGKSTVADLFVGHGAALVDTDAIAHALTAPGGAAMPALLDTFGPAVAAATGALDRAAMRARAFADPAARRQLEAILHPLIRQQAEERCQAATAPYVVLAVPLLVETGGWEKACQRILVVDCPVEIQIARVMARNTLSDDEVRRVLAAQASREARRAVADDLIDNHGRIEDLFPQVDALHARYLALAGLAT